MWSPYTYVPRRNDCQPSEISNAHSQLKKKKDWFHWPSRERERLEAVAAAMMCRSPAIGHIVMVVRSAIKNVCVKRNSQWKWLSTWDVAPTRHVCDSWIRGVCAVWGSPFENSAWGILIRDNLSSHICMQLLGNETWVLVESRVLLMLCQSVT